MIYTSYYANYYGDNGISVSRTKPPGVCCLQCLDLAPSWDLLKRYKELGEDFKRQYRKEFIHYLKTLNVHKYAKLLDGKVLLCYEKPKDFCHRHILREWFNRNGYTCEELSGRTELEYGNSCSGCKNIIETQDNTVCKCTGEVLLNPRTAKKCELKI